MNFNSKYIIYLPIVFFFLPAFSFWIPGLNKAYNFLFLFIYIALFLMFFIKPKYVINKTIAVIKNTPLKYFVLVLLLMAINGLAHIYMGNKYLFTSLRSIIMQILLCVCPFILYFICVIGKFITYRNFVKMFIFLYWILLILGIIDFFGELLNISFIKSIFDFFANARILSTIKAGYSIAPATVNKSLIRLKNLFEEPSWFARYIFIFLPLIYSYVEYKVKLFKNNFTNFLIKMTIIPLSWLNLVLTMSPIFIAFALIMSFIYYFKQIALLLKKAPAILLVIVFFISIPFVLMDNDISNIPVLSRIAVIFQIKSMEEFVVESSSLANRIVSYINTMYMFKQHPFFGIGIGNLVHTMLSQFLISPVPLTQETIWHIINSTANNTQNVNFNGGFLYIMLAENGIFITLLYLYFWVKVYKSLKTIKQFFVRNNYTFEEMMCNALLFCICNFIILFFYDYNFTNLELYIVLVLSILLIYEYKKQIRGCING